MQADHVVLLAQALVDRGRERQFNFEVAISHTDSNEQVQYKIFSKGNYGEVLKVCGIALS